MSSNDVDGGGGGGGGGGGDGDSLVLVEKASLTSLINQKSAFQRWWNSLGTSAKRLLSDPKTFIIATVIGWFYRELILPVVASVISAGAASVAAVQVLFFGTDGVLSTTGGIGLADLVLVVVGFLVDAVAPAAASILGAVDQFNLAVASVAAEAGVAAPVVVTGLRVVEIVGFGYVVWYIIRIVDVPVINLGPMLQALAAPFRALLGVFR